MKNFLIKIIYKILKIFDLITKKKFFYKILDEFEKNSYTEKVILNQNIKFFIPNEITKWRVKTFFTQEPETLNWIDGFDQNNNIFWDIGGNIGLYSVYAALKYENANIYCFEPSTSNLRILSRNISINNLQKKIKICQFALSDKKNIFQVMNETHFKEGQSMSSYFYKTDFEGKNLIPEQKYNIYGTTIDHLIETQTLNCPNYIKLDVDGIEHKILKGAKKILTNNNLKSILVEVNENYENQHLEIIKIMSENKFKLISKNQNILDVKNTKFSKTFNYIYGR